MIALLPPIWLVRLAVAAVWLYEGLWCKLLGGDPKAAYQDKTAQVRL